MEFVNEAFDPQGNLVSSETVEVPDPAPSDPDRLVAAELAGRAAYDEVMAGGTRTLARIDAANQAASAARLDALDAAIG